MKCEDSLYYHFTLAIPSCSLLRAWYQHMKGIVGTLKSWRCSSLAPNTQSRGQRSCGSVGPAQQLLCASLLLFGWFLQAGGGSLLIPSSCCSLGSAHPQPGTKSLIPGSILLPGRLAQICSALPCKCPRFWLQHFPVGSSPCQEGRWEAERDKQIFLGERLFPWGFSALTLGSCLWLLAVGAGVRKGREIRDILLNQELSSWWPCSGAWGRWKHLPA